MSIYNSPRSSNHDHIRHLLHKRTAPSHVHTHFPSPSDLTDSPSSVYSHAQFTPRPVDTNDYSSHSVHTPRPPVSDRERLNQAHESALDLDDDRHSYSSDSNYNQDRSSYCAEHDDEPESRMSMLGIKMRFHSRAPWEMGEDDIVEEDEPDHASIYRPPSRSKRSLKSFGNGSRPSGESSRSVKKSFETSSSQMSARGALQALAQASMSTSSLSLTPPPHPGQSSLRQKLSLPRIRTRTTSHSTASSFHPYSSGDTIPSPSSAVPSMQHASPVSTRPASPTRSEYSHARLDTRSVLSRSPSPVGHPYANNELHRPFTRVSEDHKSESSGGSIVVNSNDSLATLMSTGPTNSSIDNYAASTHSTHSAHSSPASILKDRIGSKEISAPLPRGSSAFQTNTNSEKRRETRIFPTSIGNGIVGWQEPQNSAFTLISLEEARAQRSRTTTIQSGTNESSGSNLTFPLSDQAYASPSGRVLTRPRGRSVSNSGKTKHMGEYNKSNFLVSKPEPTTPEGAPGGKSLKHKKSGFLRIFGKEKDRAPMHSPPLLSGFPDTIPPVPRTPKTSIHRVPVPSMSPRRDAHDGVSADSHDSQEGTVGGHATEQVSSPIRIIPSLSINTSPSAKRPFGHDSHPSTSDGRQTPFPVIALSEEQSRGTSTAATDFLGLKLRPVSTMFSSHFTDHLLDPESALSERGSERSLDMDSSTPTTTTTTTTHSGSLSPLSPNSSLHALPRSGLDKFTLAVAQDDSQSEVVRALQAQIFGAKQAWQRTIWELEGQVRDLKAEIEELKHADNGGDYCGVCGRGHRRTTREDLKAGIVHRPRAYTAMSSRLEVP